MKFATSGLIGLGVRRPVSLAGGARKFRLAARAGAGTEEATDDRLAADGAAVVDPV